MGTDNISLFILLIGESGLVRVGASSFCIIQFRFGGFHQFIQLHDLFVAQRIQFRCVKGDADFVLRLAAQTEAKLFRQLHRVVGPFRHEHLSFGGIAGFVTLEFIAGVLVAKRLHLGRKTCC